jgi:hypothetical protein
LKDNTELKSRFKPSLFAGVLTGYAVVFSLSPALQFLTGKVFGVEGISLSFAYYKFTCDLSLNSGTDNLILIIVLLIPAVENIMNIELNSYMLTKVAMGFFRNFFIVYQLVLIGYLLVNIFIGAVSVVVDLSLENDYSKIINEVLGITMPLSFLVILIVLIILTGYINITTRRMMKYINI